MEHSNKLLLLLALALSANSYGANLEENKLYEGSKGGLEWAISESRFINVVGIHDVNTFKNTVGNHTPDDAYARSELDVTGSRGCAEEEINGIGGCNRSGQGSNIPGVGYALYDDKYEASYEAMADYLYQITVSSKSGGTPASPDGYVPITFSYEISVGVWADSLSVAPTYNGDATLEAFASVELFGFGSSVPIVDEEVVVSTYMKNGGGNIFDTDSKSASLELSILDGNMYSLLLSSYVGAELWVLENGDRMNISADAYADPIITIDPDWEYAEFYELSFGMADTYFTHETTVSAVPIPAAAWLFGSGLIGLIGVARRKAHA